MASSSSSSSSLRRASGCSAPPPIKSMKLYSQVDRIFNELRAMGLAEDAPLTVEQLLPFDQYHYHGHKAVDDALACLGLSASSAVLDIGSGLGGPARYIAWKSGCSVAGVELQADLCDAARTLTRRCGLDGRVEFTNADFVTLDPPMLNTFDAIISLLVFLHITAKAALFQRCHGALRSGGRMFVEDFYRAGPLTAADSASLASALFCTDLPTKAEYVALLEAAGFVVEQVTDMTEDWTDFVHVRETSFQEKKPRNVEVLGEAVVENLAQFYAVVAHFFMSGKVGGVRLLVRKP